MLDRQAALKRFVQPEDKLLLAKVLDQADLSLRRHEMRFAFFMSPGHIFKFSKTLEYLKGDLNYMVFGGYGSAERKLIGFCPDYMEISEKDFPIKAVEIEADKRFASKLSHRDYLGSILGLGIDRDRTGDIVITENKAVLIALEDIAEYIAANLFKVGKTPVKCYIKDLDGIDMGSKNIKEVFSTVPSLRLDCIVSAAFGVSRGNAKTLIDGEKVQLNWETVTSATIMVDEGDVLSARGFGRATVLEIKGKTKKDRIGVLIGRFI